MNVAIFGASGGTGKLLTERCLAAGHTVAALLRRPAGFPYRDRVRTILGSAFDASAIAETLQGADVVLSALGAKSPFKKEDVLERAMPLIVAAMQANGPRRIIALGSAGAKPDSLDKQPAYRRWIVQKIVYNVFLKYPVESQISQWHTLSTSDLDWTMVMPPMLTNGPRQRPLPHRCRCPAAQWRPHLAGRRGGLHDAANRQPAVGQEGRLRYLVRNCWVLCAPSMMALSSWVGRKPLPAWRIQASRIDLRHPM